MNVFRLMTAVMAAAFVAMAAVQLNDPDPARWVAVYGLAALLCLLSLGRRLPSILSTALAVVTGAWALVLAVRIFGQPLPHTALLDDEEIRELGGLLIVAMGMLALTSDAREG